MATTTCCSALTDDEVLLRPTEMADIGRYFHHQDAEMARRFAWTGPATMRGLQPVFRRWVESWSAGGNERNFAIVDRASGDPIGNCEIELRADGFVHVMYAVFGPWRGRGVGTRAVHLLGEHAGEIHPGRQLLFRIHPDNHASRRVAQAVGATRHGFEWALDGHVWEQWRATTERADVSH